MKVEISFWKESQKEELRTLLFQYLKELDSILGTETNEYPYLDFYWTDPARFPIKIKLNDEIIGFALINNHFQYKPYKAEKVMAEFYIKPKFRKKGLGQVTTHKIFNYFPEKWEVQHDLNNIPAHNFWQKTIHTFTKGNYQKIKSNTTIYHLFKQQKQLQQQ